MENVRYNYDDIDDEDGSTMVVRIVEMKDSLSDLVYPNVKPPTNEFYLQNPLHTTDHNFRELKDMSTNAYVDAFFKHNFFPTAAEELENNENMVKRTYFLKYIYDYFNNELHSEFDAYLYKNSGLMLDKQNGENYHFLFKGGNVMGLAIDNLLHNDQAFKQIVESDQNMKDFINNSFGTSDFDFTVYLRIKDYKKFLHVKTYLNKFLIDKLTDVNKFFNVCLIKNTQSNQQCYNIDNVNKTIKITNKCDIQNFNALDVNNIMPITLNDANLFFHLWGCNNRSLVDNTEKDYDQAQNNNLEKELTKLLYLITTVVNNKLFPLCIYCYKKDKCIFNNPVNSDAFQKEIKDFNYNLYKIEIKNISDKELTHMLNNIKTNCLKIGSDTYNIIQIINSFITTATAQNRHLLKFISKDNLLLLLNILNILNNIFEIDHTEEPYKTNYLNDYKKIASMFGLINYQQIGVLKDKLTQLKNEYITTLGDKLTEQHTNFYNPTRIKKYFETLVEKLNYVVNTNFYKEPSDVMKQSLSYNTANQNNPKYYEIIKIIINKTNNDLWFKTNDDTSIESDYREPTIKKIEKKNKHFNCHYISYNSSIHTITNQNSIINFDLIRTKLNVVCDATYKKVGFDDIPGNYKNKTIKIPTEFIDISVGLLDDSFHAHFNLEQEEYMKKYNLHLGLNLRPGQIITTCFNVQSYTTKYMIFDLESILLSQNPYTPWSAGKYEKRINRMLFLYGIQSQQHKQQLDDIKTLVNEMYVILLKITEIRASESNNEYEQIFIYLSNLNLINFNKDDFMDGNDQFVFINMIINYLNKHKKIYDIEIGKNINAKFSKFYSYELDQFINALFYNFYMKLITDICESLLFVNNKKEKQLNDYAKDTIKKLISIQSYNKESFKQKHILYNNNDDVFYYPLENLSQEFVNYIYNIGTFMEKIYERINIVCNMTNHVSYDQLELK